MNKEQLNELSDIIDRHTPNEGTYDTAIAGLQVFKATTSNFPTPTVYNPSICLLVQGKKQVVLHRDIYEYNASEFLIVSVDLPVIGKVIKATEDAPYLALKIDVEMTTLSELIFSMDYPINKVDKISSGLNLAKADQTIGDSILRLVKMMDTPEDIPLLSAQSTREIFYRILRSKYGHLLAQIVFKGAHIERISNAIRKIKSEFHKPITVEELAKIAGMSISGFHAHFKTVTAMSPLKFQKQLRLTEARNLMLSQDLDATVAAYQVGYESPSQFNREYSRMFGNPPIRDVNILKCKNHQGL